MVKLHFDPEKSTKQHIWAVFSGSSNFNVKIRFKSLKVLQVNSRESICFSTITLGCSAALQVIGGGCCVLWIQVSGTSVSYVTSLSGINLAEELFPSRSDVKYAQDMRHQAALCLHLESQRRPHHRFELHREEDSRPFTWGGQIGTAPIISDTSEFKNGHSGAAARHVLHRLQCVMLVDIMGASSSNGSNTRRAAIYTRCGHLMNLTPFCQLLAGIFHIAE